jgi:hypothetical protein
VRVCACVCVCKLGPFLTMKNNRIKRKNVDVVSLFPQVTVFLAYFPKTKVGIRNNQPVCVSPTNNF